MMSSVYARQILAAIVMMICSSAVVADEPHAKLLKVGQYNPDDRTVDMFAGIKSGELEVKLIPKDSTQGRVLISNRADEPLNVKIPTVFAAVPILAQMMGGRSGGMGGSGMMGGGMMQSMGGGGMRGGMGGGMGGMGGGMFNVPAKKMGDYKVATVCLEHGKPEPHSTMTYEIRPLETLTEKPGVYELIEALGQGRIPQRVAQAAAWNLNNDMSWEKLAAKQIKRLNGDSYPYFSVPEMRAAVAVAQAATTAATATAQKGSAKKSTAATSAAYSTSPSPLSIPATSRRDVKK